MPMVKPPSPLFKYVSGARAVQILRDRSVRFTQPGQFNDPFELCPTLDIERLKKSYLARFSSQRMRRAGQSEKEVMKGFEDYLKAVGRTLTSQTAKVGVLSLSARCDVPLLWSHYASSHDGVAIGFRVTAGLVGKPFRRSSDLFGFGPVDYGTDRYIYPQPNKPKISYMFRKDVCWAYEREWRIVRPLADLVESAPGIFLSHFPTEAVRCIVFGARTPEPVVQEILDLMHMEYPEAHQYRAGQSAEKFEMEIDTYMGDMLRRQDYYLEETFRPGVSTFYNYISEGRLYKAVGMIADDVVFESAADRFDYNP